METSTITDTDGISIILPVFNEELVIEKTLRNLHDEFNGKIDFEIIVAEDGSTDSTVEILKKLEPVLGLRVYSQKDRAGYLGAIKRAMEFPKYNWVFLVDSDNQYYPSDFWLLWSNRHQHDIILGQKIERKDNIFRKALSGGFNSLIRLLFNLKYRDIDTGFRLINTKVAREIVPSVTYNKTFTAEFVIRAHKGNYKIKEVPIRHRVRDSGRSNIFRIDTVSSIILEETSGLVKLFRELKIS